jgi:hypothetical protein
MRCYQFITAHVAQHPCTRPEVGVHIWVRSVADLYGSEAECGQQDPDNHDVFHCMTTGEVARRFQLEGRPRCTWTEYIENHDGTGQPAMIVHGPGYTRTYIGVGGLV